MAVDERFLGVEVAGGDGDRRVPRLLHAHVLGLRRAGAEAGPAVDDLEVVHDIALRPVGHHLGDADLVLAGQPADLLVVGDDARQLVDPRQAQIAHSLSSWPLVLCRIVTDDLPHGDAAVEEWVFACWTPDAAVGVRDRVPAASLGCASVVLGGRRPPR